MRGVGREAWGRAQKIVRRAATNRDSPVQWCEDLRRSRIALSCMDTAKEGLGRGGAEKLFPVWLACYLMGDDRIVRQPTRSTDIGT